MIEEEDKQAGKKDRELSGIDLARKAAALLSGKKGQDIILLDVGGLSSITDYILIVSGNSPPHLKALLNETEKELKSNGLYCYSKAGSPESGWIVLDYVDVVIHIFSEEKRDYYSIEDLWDQARRINPETDGR